jgi:hypothetical protein
VSDEKVKLRLDRSGYSHIIRLPAVDAVRMSRDVVSGEGFPWPISREPNRSRPGSPSSRCGSPSGSESPGSVGERVQAARWAETGGRITPDREANSNALVS